MKHTLCVCRKVKSGPGCQESYRLSKQNDSIGHAQRVSDNSIVGCDGVVVTYSLGKPEIPGSNPGLKLSGE